MTATESRSCRGYRSKTRSVLLPQDSSEAHSWSSQVGGLPPSACGNLHAIVAPVGDWEGGLRGIPEATAQNDNRMGGIPEATAQNDNRMGGIPEATAQNDKSIAYSCLGPATGLDVV